MKKQYVTNFSPAEYFGCDGADPATGPWAEWFAGKADFFDPDYAQFVWWHVCEMQLLFCDIGAALGEPVGRSPGEFEASINWHLGLAESHLGGSLQLDNPFAFDSDVSGIHDADGRTSAMILLAYAIWCIDRMIDALRVGDAKTAAAAATYGLRALELTHEYRDDFPEVKARLESKRQRERANARYATDEKQADKNFVRECWHEWQKQPDRYRSKAAFARDVIEKSKHLQSTKVIEDWCREWEIANRKSAGRLRIVPVDR